MDGVVYKREPYFYFYLKKKKGLYFTGRWDVVVIAKMMIVGARTVHVLLHYYNV
jgi:hypothetical protein